METVRDITHSFLSFSSDVVVVLIFAAIGSAVSLYYGKSRILALIFSFYPAIVLFETIPVLDSLRDKNPVSLNDAAPSFAIFVAVYVLSFLALRKLISAEFSFSRVKRTLEGIAFGTMFASLVVYVSYHVINIQKIYNFSPGIDKLFLSTVAFWWLVIPFAAVLILRR